MCEPSLLKTAVLLLKTLMYTRLGGWRTVLVFVIKVRCSDRTTLFYRGCWKEIRVRNYRKQKNDLLYGYCLYSKQKPSRPLLRTEGSWVIVDGRTIISWSIQKHEFEPSPGREQKIRSRINNTLTFVEKKSLARGHRVNVGSEKTPRAGGLFM